MQKTFYILFFLVLLITSSLAQETFLSLKKIKLMFVMDLALTQILNMFIKK